LLTWLPPAAALAGPVRLMLVARGRQEEGRARSLLDRDRLREVSRLVDVVPAAIRDVVREQLERDDGEHGLEELLRPRDAADLLGAAGDLLVVVVGHGDDDAGARPDLLHVRADLLVHGV